MSMKKQFVTSRKERVGHYSYGIGANIIYLMVTMYLAVYYTDFLGISTETVAAIFLGARIWDAINDPLIALLVEKTNLKRGKYKPWVQAVAIVIPIVTTLLFGFTETIAAWSMSTKVIFATVSYILWGMIYTTGDSPGFALTTVMTDNSYEKNTIVSMGKIFSMAGILLAVVGTPIFVEMADENWSLVVMLLSILAFILMIQISYVKERTVVKNETPKLRDIVGAIFGNKYVIRYILLYTIYSGFNFISVLGPYLAADVFNDFSLTSIIGLVTMLPTLMIAPFVPKLVVKFGKRSIFIFSFIALIALSILTYITGYDNFTLFIIITFVKGVLIAPLTLINELFYFDMIDYGYYKTGKKFGAAVFSARTFSVKGAGAISGGLGMLLLGFVGYQEASVGEIVVQTHATVDGIWTISQLGIVVGAAIALVLFWKFYDLTEKKLETMKNEVKNEK